MFRRETGINQQIVFYLFSRVGAGPTIALTPVRHDASQTCASLEPEPLLQWLELPKKWAQGSRPRPSTLPGPCLLPRAGLEPWACGKRTAPCCSEALSGAWTLFTGTRTKRARVAGGGFLIGLSGCQLSHHGEMVMMVSIFAGVA